MRIRSSARWVLVAIAVAALLVAVQRGPRNPVTAHAAAPDVYQASAASAAQDTRNYQTGSAVDPAPAANTAQPLTSLTANNSPSTGAHAAYAEPPQTAQAASGLQNVPVPYTTQADALCVACTSPVTKDADGNTDQNLNGSRLQTGSGHAHVSAAAQQATAEASNGKQTAGADDQITNLYNAAVFDVYGQINKPAPSASPGQPTVPPPPSALASPPACQSVPQPAPSSAPSVCPGVLPETGVLAQSGSSTSRATIAPDPVTGAMVLDSVATSNDNQIADGLITIGSVRVEVRGTGDGTAGNSRITATNDIQHVCVGGDCHYSITPEGICTNPGNVQACENDPVNQSLRKNGINVCRLGTATSGDRSSTVTGSALGVLVEFHAVGTANNGYNPDPSYYDNQQGLCSPSPPTPRPGYAGLSSYTIIGEASAQLFTRSFPTCTACSAQESVPQPVSLDTGGTSTVTTLPGAAGSTQTITTTLGGGTGAPLTGTSPANRSSAPGTLQPEIATSAPLGPDHRPLELAAFAMLEVVLLGNLTAISRLRRARR